MIGQKIFLSLPCNGEPFCDIKGEELFGGQVMHPPSIHPPSPILLMDSTIVMKDNATA